MSAIDSLLGRIRESSIDGGRLHKVATHLATKSAHRGPVKLGIALLGLFPADLHREVLLTLGRHEGVTLYAAVALSNGQDDPDDDLWHLAQQVRGWGRIHLVELSPTPNDATFSTGFCATGSATRSWTSTWRIGPHPGAICWLP